MDSVQNVPQAQPQPTPFGMSQPASQPPVAGQSTSPAPESPQTPATSGRNKKTLGIILAVIIILAGGGYAAYANYFGPTRVWQKFVSSGLNQKVASEDFNFSYRDNGKPDSSSADNPFMGMFTDIHFSATGTQYSNVSDINNPQIKMDLTYSFGSGDTSISSKAAMAMLGKDLYFNFGNNPFINSVLAYLSPGQKVDWIKLNLDDLNKLASSTTPNNYDLSKQYQAYQDIIANYLPKAVLMDKYLGQETIHGVRSMHFSNKVDKTQAKTLAHAVVDQMFKQIAEQGSLPTSTDVSQAKPIIYKVADNFIDRAQFFDLETWIGISDGQLHKIKYTFSAPSLATFIAAGSAHPDALDGLTSEQSTDKILQYITFDGMISGSQEVYDIGKSQTVAAPANAFDLSKKLQELNQEATGTIPRLDIPTAQ